MLGPTSITINSTSIELRHLTYKKRAPEFLASAPKISAMVSFNEKPLTFVRASDAVALLRFYGQRQEEKLKNFKNDFTSYLKSLEPNLFTDEWLDYLIPSTIGKGNFGAIPQRAPALGKGNHLIPLFLVPYALSLLKFSAKEIGDFFKGVELEGPQEKTLRYNLDFVMSKENMEKKSRDIVVMENNALREKNSELEENLRRRNEVIRNLEAEKKHLLIALESLIKGSRSLNNN